MSLLSEYRQVNRLLQEKQQVVFYSESRHYYQYFEKLITDLLQDNNTGICYITSDPNDPLLKSSHPKIKVVYVKWMLGFLFSRISADVMIMTMPDLGNYLFKRSSGVGTYIYIFHAAVSTHLQYRKNAFFNYDAVFCTGEYQVNEIRKAEELYAQSQKELIRYGYPLFDTIKAKSVSKDQQKPAILVAPSWFKDCIFETCFEELVEQLAKLPYNVFIRSHPEFEKREKKKFRKLREIIRDYSSMSIDQFTNVIDRLPVTDILITDRSGIAFEFAFGTMQPVLFIETPMKQTNPDWQKTGWIPIENEVRDELGISVLPADLNQLPQKIKEVELMKASFRQKIQALEKNTFYNSPGSYRAGVEYVLSKIRTS